MTERIDDDGKTMPTLKSLVREVMAWHSMPDSPDYCECEKSPCLWCANAKRALGDATPNHPVVASKMVGTLTPRVDEMVERLHGSDTQPFLDFARQLERELDAMTRERDAWRECADELYKSCKHIGYTSCGEGHIIQRAERAVCAFEMLDNLTPSEASGPSSASPQTQTPC